MNETEELKQQIADLQRKLSSSEADRVLLLKNIKPWAELGVRYRIEKRKQLAISQFDEVDKPAWNAMMVDYLEKALRHETVINLPQSGS